jgi:hypothetical protein
MLCESYKTSCVASCYEGLKGSYTAGHTETCFCVNNCVDDKASQVSRSAIGLGVVAAGTSAFFLQKGIKDSQAPASTRILRISIGILSAIGGACCFALSLMSPPCPSTRDSCLEPLRRYTPSFG